LIKTKTTRCRNYRIRIGKLGICSLLFYCIARSILNALAARLVNVRFSQNLRQTFICILLPELTQPFGSATECISLHP